MATFVRKLSNEVSVNERIICKTSGRASEQCSFSVDQVDCDSDAKEEKQKVKVGEGMGSNWEKKPRQKA